jgi:hypothetical protein
MVSSRSNVVGNWRSRRGDFAIEAFGRLCFEYSGLNHWNQPPPQGSKFEIMTFHIFGSYVSELILVFLVFSRFTVGRSLFQTSRVTINFPLAQQGHDMEYFDS